MDLKTRILDLLRQAHRAEQALLATLTDVQRATHGEPDHWSPKDTIAHNAFWKDRGAEGLEEFVQGRPLPSYDEYDKINAEIFEEYRHRPWDEILALSARAHDRLIQDVEGLTADQLLNAGPLVGQDGRPLWRKVVGAGYIHPVWHIALLYLEFGAVDRATALYEQMADRLPVLDEDPTWRGTIRYNLACHYALTGQTERAISELRDALELNPGLTEWSQQDPDFASIRETPAYQAAYQAIYQP